MNKLNILIIIFALFISGCKSKEKFTNFPLQRIDDFNLNIYSKDGKKIYSIQSPSSKIDIVKNILNLQETRINLFDEEILKYTITSQESKLQNSNRIIELIGDVLVKSYIEEDIILNADKFTWNINNEEYELLGNVRFENNEFIISSQRAYMNKENNIIEFYNPVNYIVKDNNTNRFEVKSENAFYNIEKNSLNFSSKEKRVRSKIYF
tara:strand:- start:560 stop:1183 length:624 start_codon:yes stop_codon:yes gene_type:complete